MKKLIIIILLIQASVFTAKAQLGFNYSQYSIGLGIDYIKASTSVPNQLSYPAFHFNMGYNVSPYTNFSLEFQFGTLSGGFDQYYANKVAALDPKSAKYDSLLNDIPIQYVKTDPYELNYTNHFQMVNIHADMGLGEIMNFNDDSWTSYLKDIYIGTGIGMVFNNISDNHSRLSPDSTYYIGGSDKSQNIVIPARIGYQYKLYNSYDIPSIILEVGYQRNFVLGYGLDGFADPLVAKKLESYSGLHFSIKFNFGSITSWRKSFH